MTKPGRSGFFHIERTHKVFLALEFDSEPCSQMPCHCSLHLGLCDARRHGGDRGMDVMDMVRSLPSDGEEQSMLLSLMNSLRILHVLGNSLADERQQSVVTMSTATRLAVVDDREE